MFRSFACVHAAQARKAHALQGVSPAEHQVVLQKPCLLYTSALALSHTSHCQIHADLAALTLKVCAQAIHDLLRHALGLADANNRCV